MEFYELSHRRHAFFNNLNNKAVPFYKGLKAARSSQESG